MNLGFNIGFLEIGFLDIVEILLIGYLLYRIYVLLQGSVALKVLIGFFFIYFFYLLVKAINMNLLSTILGSFMNIGFLVVAIVFQQEIRKFLFLIGGTTLNNYFYKKFYWIRGKNVVDVDIAPIVDALKLLGGSNTGALIVISKTDDLKFYENSGDRIDALISKRLLLAIFNKNSPLHDGSVIINRDKIAAARCILPVTEKENISAQFGLRHRAAIGVSEVTSALVLVVSEETGQIAIAKGGNLKVNLSLQEIRSELRRFYKNKLVND